jgi:hypothetical protein
MAVPLDRDGRRPGDVAPEDRRDALRAIEQRYFRELK